MAIQIPIISEFQDKGIKRAIAEFKQLEGAGKKTGFIVKKAMLPATAAVGALGVAAKEVIGAASDLAEAQSKVNVIFGEGATEITNFSKTAAKQIGQSRQSVLDAAGTFGTFGKAAGLSGKDLAKFSIDFTKLASDIASFSNATPEEVITALGAGLRGESEPLRRFGVLLSADAIELEAVNMGIVKFSKNAATLKRATLAAEKAQIKYGQAVKQFGPDSLQARTALAAYEIAQQKVAKEMAGKMDKLTQEQKILAATSLIYKQTTDAQGDFARTSDGLANSQRTMTAEFDNLKTQLGEFLLPIMIKILPYLKDFAQWASDNPKVIGAIAVGIGVLTAAVIALNVAMALNPAVLITAGIIALGAGLVLAYQKFETFRTIVDTVMGVVKWWFETVTVPLFKAVLVAGEAIFTGLKAVITNVAVPAFKVFKEIMGGVFDGVKATIDEVIIPAFRGLLAVVKTIFNGIATAWNNTFGKLSFSIPNWVPGIGGKGFNVPDIPMLANGGIVTGPTLAMVGEAGPEAVIPLDRAGGMGAVTINVNGGDPQAVVDALRRYYRQNGPLPVAVAL